MKQVWVTDETHQALKEARARYGLSLSHVIRCGVERFLRDYKRLEAQLDEYNEGEQPASRRAKA